MVVVVVVVIIMVIIIFIIIIFIFTDSRGASSWEAASPQSSLCKHFAPILGLRGHIARH
jgi:uncharacterized alpha/beta hydrolase family protein